MIKYFLLIMLWVTPLSARYQPQYIDENWYGNQAYFAGDYKKALKKFNLALDLSIKSNDKQYQAIAMYGLARAHAHLCNLEQSEKFFLESIELRETLPDDTYAHLTQNLLEYSRFLMTHDRDDEALPYMDRATALLESLGIEQSDPIAYANFLDNYEKILRSNGRVTDADKASSRADELRSKYPEKKAKFIPENYPVNCN